MKSCNGEESKDSDDVVDFVAHVRVRFSTSNILSLASLEGVWSLLQRPSFFVFSAKQKYASLFVVWCVVMLYVRSSCFE